MARSDSEWLADLANENRRGEASRDLRDFLRRTLARGFGRQLADADLDDLAQESVMRVLERRADFRGASQFTTWAASVAVNGALSELRRRKFRSLSLDEAKETARSALLEAPKGPTELQRDDLHRSLYRAIDETLTSAQKDALLAELGGLPLMEIARRTGRRRGTLYKLLHDARKKLRAHLEQAGITTEDLAEPTDGEATA